MRVLPITVFVCVLSAKVDLFLGIQHTKGTYKERTADIMTINIESY